MSRSILVCGTNWIGDAVMMMPALQLLREAQPSSRITLLVKPKLESLWRLHGAVDEVLTLEMGVVGTLRTAGRLRRQRFDQVHICPHSIRSALIPALAGIPIRVGLPGMLRSFLTTHTVEPSTAGGHQALEYLELFGLMEVGTLPDPRINVDEIVLPASLGVQRCISLIPGAARGSSKQWPVERFAEVGRTLAAETGSRVIVHGGPGEEEVCAAVAEQVGGDVVSLAGQTKLPQFAACLARSRVVIGNDSGGMHLATAVGVPVVGVFGLTDPTCTGPLGRQSRVAAAAGVTGSRDIPRESDPAREALERVSADHVLSLAREICIQSTD